MDPVIVNDAEPSIVPPEDCTIILLLPLVTVILIVISLPLLEEAAGKVRVMAPVDILQKINWSLSDMVYGEFVLDFVVVATDKPPDAFVMPATVSPAAPPEISSIVMVFVPDL